MSQPITLLLHRWSEGHVEALEELLPVVFEDLRKMARSQFPHRRGVTLQPTAVVHEVYLRLVGVRVTGFENRAQFFAFASRVIRLVILDYSRSRSAKKRGGELARISLEDLPHLASRSIEPELLVAVHESLERLQELDPQQSRLVELRYFLGLTQREAAEVLEISLATAERSWAIARRWLARELGRRF